VLASTERRIALQKGAPESRRHHGEEAIAFAHPFRLSGDEEPKREMPQMTPEELAKYRSEKLQKSQKEEEDRKRVEDEQKARYVSDIAPLRSALQQIALPYLQNVALAMSGALKVTPVRDTDGELAVC
jgi:Mg-chelatase subunit ChlI